MTTDVLARAAVSEVPKRQVHWRDLATLVADRGLRPSGSHTAGRVYVEVDGTLVWADCAGVTLDLEAPGATAVADARVRAWAEDERARDDAWLAGLSADQRHEVLAERRRVQAMPDPSDAQVDAARERNVGGYW